MRQIPINPFTRILTKSMKDPFTPKAVCQALLSHGNITEVQAQEIVKKEASLRKRLEEMRARRRSQKSGNELIYNPITIVDVLIPLNIQRADDAFKGLDEDIIFEALARQYWLARQAGEPVILSEAQMRSVTARFKGYGRKPSTG